MLCEIIMPMQFIHNDLGHMKGGEIVEITLTSGALLAAANDARVRNFVEHRLPA